MLPHYFSAVQPQPHEDPLHTWPLRRLAEQAARLYESPQAQQLALLHHASLMRQHAPTPTRLLLWDDVVLALDLDHPGARARRGER